MKKKYLACSLFFMVNMCAESVQDYCVSVEITSIAIVADDAPEPVNLDLLKIEVRCFYRKYSEHRILLKRLIEERSLLLDAIGRTVEIYSGIDQLSTLQQKIDSTKSHLKKLRIFRAQIDQLIKEINVKIECDENFDVLGRRLFEILAEAEAALVYEFDEIE